MLGSIISAGANLLGGLMGKNSADSAQRSNEEMNARNIRLQREFAQNGIRWKVDDARAAGIHPLYALGAPTVSYQPASVGAVADTSMANAMANMGQDLSRAINTTRTSEERDQAFADTVQALTIQKMGLENELLGSQIAKLRQTSNPPMPGDSSLQIGGVKWLTDPKTVDSDAISQRYGEPGEWLAAPMIMWEDYKKNSPGEFSIRPNSPAAWAVEAFRRWRDGRSSPVNRRQRGWGSRERR